MFRDFLSPIISAKSVKYKRMSHCKNKNLIDFTFFFTIVLYNNIFLDQSLLNIEGVDVGNFCSVLSSMH